MSWNPLFTSPLRPFRAASAGSGRSNLLDKMMSRPTVAKVPPSSTGAVEEQDAVLSGMTRSLHRRLSGLNVPAAIRSAAGQRRAA